MTIKTWTFAYNTTPTDQTTAQRQAASLHFQRKEFLVAGGWSVNRSCDSTQVVDGDCLTDVTSDFVWSASGARSWMELKSPEGFWPGLDGTYTGDQSRCWLTVHLNNVDVYKAEMYIHNSQPSGTASTTACPTSTNKIGYTAQQMLRAAFVSNAAFHFARTSQGQWFEFVGYSAAGICPWHFILYPLTDLNYNASTSKEYPYAGVLYGRYYDNTGGGAVDAGGVGPVTGAGGLQMFYHDGTTTTGVASVYASNASGSFVGPGYGFSAVTRDTFSYTFPVSPLDVRVYVTGKHCRVGRIADVFFSAAPFAQGDVDYAGSPTKVFLGSFLFPTNTFVSL